MTGSPSLGMAREKGASLDEEPEEEMPPALWEPLRSVQDTALGAAFALLLRPGRGCAQLFSHCRLKLLLELGAPQPGCSRVSAGTVELTAAPDLINGESLQNIKKR